MYTPTACVVRVEVMYISFRNEACFDVYDVLRQGEGYEISIMKGWVMAVVCVGLKWTSNWYDDNRFQGFVTYVVQYKVRKSPLRSNAYVTDISSVFYKQSAMWRRKGKVSFADVSVFQFYCVRVWYPYVHSEGCCRLIDNTNVLARGQSTHNCLELQGVFAVLFRFYLLKLLEM
jgi:hypothetical protein